MLKCDKSDRSDLRQSGQRARADSFVSVRRVHSVQISCLSDVGCRERCRVPGTYQRGVSAGGGGPAQSTWRNRRALGERALFSRLSCVLGLYCTLSARSPAAQEEVGRGGTCGAGPPRCKWPFSQPRRLLLSATHSHLVPLLFSSTNHFILAGSPPSVLCWQEAFDSNVMQAQRSRRFNELCAKKRMCCFCSLRICKTGVK